MLTRISPITGLVLLLVFPLSFQGQNREDWPRIFEAIRPSIVLVVGIDNKGTPTQRGTGFCLALNRIVTNRHVIEKAARIEVHSADGTIYSVEKIESIDETGDLALLQTIQLDKNIKPLTLAKIGPRVGERVIVVGNPRGLEGSLSDGIVAGFRNSPKLGKLIQITAPISAGSSGSPVINVNGDVVGVATSSVEGGQNLNFAISSERLIQLWSNQLLISTKQGGEATSISSRWRIIPETDLFYDIETLRRNLGRVTVWIRSSKFSETRDKFWTGIDCSKSRIRYLRILLYDENGSWTDNDVPGEWMGVVPDTKSEKMLAIFCKK